jgi:hypothetical protein
MASNAAASPDNGDQALLREKLRLLEADRKTYFESSSVQLRGNKDTIKGLRNENKDLKAVVAAAKRGPGNLQAKETVRLDQDIYTATLRLDDMKEREQELRRKMDKEREVLTDIKVNSEPILTPEHFLTRKISMLENRLDKSLIKFNEAVSIKRTYEQIVKRLREERVGFDNQLAAIERTLRAKDGDYQELLKTSHEANHAKELAKRDLQAFKVRFDEDRKAKDRELGERKAYVQAKVDQTQRLERKEKQRRMEEADGERARAEQGDLGRGGNSQMIVGRGGATERSAEEDERLSQYEAAFKRIRDATGVSDVQDVLQRFISQEETHKNLVGMSREAQARIDQLKSENGELAAQLEELRYSGCGQLGSRRIIEEFEVHLAEAGNQSHTNGERYEQLAKLLINVKAGVEHVLDKLTQVRSDIVAPAMADETVVEVLKVCEQKMVTIADEVAPGDVGAEDMMIQLTELPAYNRRVRLPRDDDDDDDEDAHHAGHGQAQLADNQDDDAVFKRDQVKQMSVNAIQREAKKLRRRKKDKM